MKRIPEHELMLDPETVSAYADADFDEPHSNFINLFKKAFQDINIVGKVLDIGCGPGDISFRMASEFPGVKIHAIDGSMEMMKYADKLLAGKNEIKERIIFIHSMLQEYSPRDHYDYIISNSLLHHLPDPMILWESIKRLSTSGTSVFLMDLSRPLSTYDAMKLANSYTEDEPEILTKEFYNSLLSAFNINEVENQLQSTNLDLLVEKVSDRHMIIYGSV